MFRKLFKRRESANVKPTKIEPRIPEVKFFEPLRVIRKQPPNKDKPK